MKDTLADCQDRMKKAIEALHREFSRLRTGRASTSLVENLKVDYYGTVTPLNQISSITTPDARTITIQPWDKGAFGLIDKAIQKSDLGLNPVNDGKIIRINIPPLTEDRRKDLAKVAKKFAEEAKVAIRNVRRDVNDHVKKKLKDKEITEDEERKSEAEVQKLTDKFVAECDATLAKKEKEIMEI